MSKICSITSKKTRFQKTSTSKGSTKKKGGVGLKKVGIHKRKLKPNLLKKTLWIDGKPQKVWLSTKALRSLDPALLVNPNKRKNT